MMRVFHVPLLLAVLMGPAAAQDAARKFPLSKPFKVISISGFDVQKAGMTLTIAPEPQGNRLVGSGHAGCNGWSATAVIREDQIDVTNVVTTKKFCGKPRMTSEEAFLTTLKSAQRWRIDDKSRLILEGEAARLLLTAGGAGKRPEARSDKKPAKQPASR
jgi:heat shock protein HslJ